MISKGLLSNFLEDTNSLIELIRGKYGKEDKAIKLIEDIQEEVIEDFRKLKNASCTEANDYFIRKRDQVQDIIRELGL